MNPMIKYRGGKSKEISHFINHMPKQYSRYIEPFLEEGLYIFTFSQKRRNSFYKEMQEKYPDARIQLDRLQKIYEENQAAYFYFLRSTV